MELHQLPERPTQPPELPTGIQIICNSIRRETYRSEKRYATHMVLKILCERKGLLRTIVDDREVDFDHGDLWDTMFSSEEPADLSILAQATLLTAAADHTAHGCDVRTAAYRYMIKRITEFVEQHADRMAAHDVELHMIEMGVTA